MEFIRVVAPDKQFAGNALEWALDREIELARMAVQVSKDRIKEFEDKYGRSLRSALNRRGKVDELVLAEWEGEVEALDRLKRKVAALKDIRIWHE